MSGFIFFNKEKKVNIYILNYSKNIKVSDGIKKEIKKISNEYKFKIYKKGIAKEFELKQIIKDADYVIIIVDKNEIIDDYSIRVINNSFEIILNGIVKKIDFKSKIIEEISASTKTIIISAIPQIRYFYYNSEEKDKNNLLHVLDEIIKNIKANKIGNITFSPIIKDKLQAIKKINFYLSYKIFFHNHTHSELIKNKIEALNNDLANENVELKLYDLDKIFENNFNEIIENSNDIINIVVIAPEYSHYKDLFIFAKANIYSINMEIIKKMTLNFEYLYIKEADEIFNNFVNFFSKLKNLIFIEAIKSYFGDKIDYSFFSSNIVNIVKNISIVKYYLIDNIEKFVFKFNESEFMNYLNEVNDDYIEILNYN